MSASFFGTFHFGVFFTAIYMMSQCCRFFNLLEVIGGNEVRAEFSRGKLTTFYMYAEGNFSSMHIF